MRRGDRITEVYAYICLDEKDDCEGIPAILVNDPMTNQPISMPLVGADRERILSLKDIVKELAQKTGKPIRLVRFTQIQELGDVKP